MRLCFSACLTLQYQELSHLTNSFTQLRQAQAKFKACMDDVKQVTPANKGPHGSLSV